MKAANLVVLMIVGAVATGAGGWYSAELPNDLFTDELLVTRSAPPPKAIESQAPRLRAAIGTIRELGLVSQPVVETPQEPLSDAPPQPEVEDVLALALKAIIREGDAYAALLQDAETGVSERFRRGQRYVDGWRFDRVTPSEITLKKGTETRTVPVMLRTDAVPVPEPAVPQP